MPSGFVEYRCRPLRAEGSQRVNSTRPFCSTVPYRSLAGLKVDLVDVRAVGVHHVQRERGLVARIRSALRTAACLRRAGSPWPGAGASTRTGCGRRVDRPGRRPGLLPRRCRTMITRRSASVAMSYSQMFQVGGSSSSSMSSSGPRIAKATCRPSGATGEILDVVAVVACSRHAIGRAGAR